MWNHLILCLLLTGSFRAHAQSTPHTLDLVSWNVEWFGSTSNGPAQEALQEQNVVRVLRQLNADIYGLVEIVDTAALRRVRDSLGSNWAYVVSPYASGNTTGTGSGWLTGQKLAFLYNTDHFGNVRARGMLRTSANAYTNWASGRFPFLLTAQVSIGTMSREVNFILLHGKAGSTPTDYNRRRDGAQELKDTLDQFFSHTPNIIFGDYNDALNTTICAGCGTNLTSYYSIVIDSTDSDRYRSITFPLGAMGQSSMTSFPNVVDNHAISNELEVFYVPGSAQIRTDVASIVTDYGTTTSDHYPVFSQYNLAATGLMTVSLPVFGMEVGPNPVQGMLRIRATKLLRRAGIRLYDSRGQLLFQTPARDWTPGQVLDLPAGGLAKGVYYLQLVSDRYQTTVPVVR